MQIDHKTLFLDHGVLQNYFPPEVTAQETVQEMPRVTDSSHAITEG